MKKYKEYTVAIAIQSKHSKVPTDFRFENTSIMLDLDQVIWCKQYFHEATDKFKDEYTDILIFGQSKPITLKINYEKFKKQLKQN